MRYLFSALFISLILLLLVSCGVKTKSTVEPITVEVRDSKHELDVVHGIDVESFEQLFEVACKKYLDDPDKLQECKDAKFNALLNVFENINNKEKPGKNK